MKFKSHSSKLLFRVVKSPSLVLIFKFFIHFEELKCKELLLKLYKSKPLNLIKNLFPYEFNIDLKLKLSSILQSNKNLHIVFIIDILVEFLYFCQGKGTDLEPHIDYVKFVISDYKFNFLILAIWCFAINAFWLEKDDCLAVDNLSFVQSDLLETWKFLESFIPVDKKSKYRLSLTY